MMSFKSKTTQLLILGVTALSLSRALFFFFNDPEGPNLVVVVGAAVIVYAVSLVTYAFNASDSKKLVFAILIQVVAVLILYVTLR